MSIWEPYLQDPLYPGMDWIFDALSGYGWDTATNRFRDRHGGKPCTFPALVDEMHKGGVVLFHSHGPAQHHLGWVAVKYVYSEKEATDWIIDPETGEPDPRGFTLAYCYATGDWPGKWGIYAPPSWFNTYWSESLTNNKAVAMFMACYSAYGGAASVMARAGGRASCGYSGMVAHGTLVATTRRILQRLTGQSVDGFPGEARGANRTWGRATTAGGISPLLVKWGGDVSKWTTLNPAPTLPEPVFPQQLVSRKGAGCIIFDTYMDDSQDPGQAVVVKTGSGVHEQRWFPNMGGYDYLVSFDFDNGGVTMQAEADQCLNRDPVGGADKRKLSGDRQTYESDKEWSF